MGGVVVAAVEEADGVSSGQAAEELDETDLVVDFEIGSRHCGMENQLNNWRLDRKWSFQSRMRNASN
jgi:hypothetical protein